LFHPRKKEKVKGGGWRGEVETWQRRWKRKKKVSCYETLSQWVAEDLKMILGFVGMAQVGRVPA
jgi:hypothetical protein